MGYRNAQDIFPEGLLRQIQRYVAGETIYIPAGDERKAWGETSGYQRYIRERNGAIREDFAAGMTIGELMDKYALSYDSIKRIVYNRRESVMLRYSATLSSAKAYADAGKLDAWIHLYLNEEGRNIPFSDGLKLFDRYYIGPALFPIGLFKRCTGPEPEMKYRIDRDWWEHRIAELEKVIPEEHDLPPLIIHYAEGGFELNDGNHRHKAYEDLGIDQVWAVIWITEKEELDDFIERFGDHVRGCRVIRR